MRKTISIGFLAALLALAGCDDGNGDMDPDGGTPVDDGGTNNGGDDGGTNNGDDDGGTNNGGDGGAPPVGACEGARVIELEMGEQTISGDTTGMSSGLTLGCAEPNAHEVVALTVPGTGPKAVVFSLENEGTSEEFDTIVEARVGSCELPDEPLCYDDVLYAGIFVLDYRSEGVILAQGGQTVNFIVSGHSEPDVGPWTADLEVADANPPTISEAEALRVAGERYDFFVDGGDPDGDAAGISYRLLDEDGDAIGVDWDGDGTVDDYEFVWSFEHNWQGHTSFTGALVRDADADLLEATAAATHVEVAVLDRFGLTSSTIMVPIRDVTEADLGEACDADTICAPGFECTSGVCEIAAAVQTACTMAAEDIDALTVGSPTSITGTVDVGHGMFEGSCQWTTGAESVHLVEVPSPTGSAIGYDLIASTDNSATGDTDTIVYIRNECGIPSSELACEDDIDYPDNPRSIAIAENASQGTHTIIVEMWPGIQTPGPYQLDVSLRPVLGAGEACDPAEVENRCSTGTCPAGDDPVCPDPAP